MISIVVNKNKDGYCSFTCKGHAGYADSGKDLVCCAVSTLVINAINSIEKLSKSKFKVKTDDKSGYIDFKFIDLASSEANLLIDSMLIGLEEMVNDYGEFVKLEIKEV